MIAWVLVLACARPAAPPLIPPPAAPVHAAPPPSAVAAPADGVSGVLPATPPTIKGEPPSGLTDGAACRTGDDCASGVCEGVGCGDDALGACQPELRACTKDYSPMCGCDGATFHGSSSCPRVRYAHRGPCPEG